jgi:hypothetical protein
MTYVETVALVTGEIMRFDDSSVTLEFSDRSVIAIRLFSIYVVYFSVFHNNLRQP